jgi:hypothetical protein
MTGDGAAISEPSQGRIASFALLDGRATRPERAPALRKAPSDVAGKHGGGLLAAFADGIDTSSSAGGIPAAEATCRHGDSVQITRISSQQRRYFFLLSFAL